jgi:hypothetical protein
MATISNVVQKGLVSPYISPASAYVPSPVSKTSGVVSTSANSMTPNMSTNSGPAYSPPASTSSGFSSSLPYTPAQNSGATTTPYSGYTPPQTTYTSPASSYVPSPKSNGAGTVTSPAPAYTGQGLSTEQQANAKTPEQIAAENALKNPPQNNQTKPTYNTDPYTANAPTYSGLVGSLAGQATAPTQQYIDAQNQYLEANKALSSLREEAATQTRNIGGSRTNLAEAGGEQGLLQNLVAGKEAALAGQMSAAQAAAQTATGQQSAQMSGMGAAAGLGAPQQAGPTNVPFNPLTGQYGTPAAGAYGDGTTGGLQGVGNISGQMEIGGQVAQQNSMLGSAQTTGDALKTLISQNDINPSAFTPFNGVVQTIGAYTSNEAYQKFSGQISDFVSKIAPILGGPGGNTTDYRTQLAGTILNRWASGESINNVITYFLNQAKQNIEGLKTGGGAGYGSQSNQSSNQQGDNLYSW